MKQIIIGALFALAGMSVAAAQDMTCAEFNAMSEDAQAEAVAGLAGTVEGQGNIAAAVVAERNEAATDDPQPADVTQPQDSPGNVEGSGPLEAATVNCAENPDTMLNEAITAG
ncbi:hypothetical protein [Acuticoccus sp.]|uniref:hypothetical protein n=1 Tax=Acuticoccus sp. TaxID=1904378 RepID=UPI003B52A2CA